METLHIEIGCPPGAIRPNSLLMSLLSEMGKSENEKIVVWATDYINNPPSCSTIFGDMNCSLKINSDIKNEVQRYFQTELTKLYNSGVIRYASW